MFLSFSMPKVAIRKTHAHYGMILSVVWNTFYVSIFFLFFIFTFTFLHVHHSIYSRVSVIYLVTGQCCYFCFACEIIDETNFKITNIHWTFTIIPFYLFYFRSFSVILWFVIIHRWMFFPDSSVCVQMLFICILLLNRSFSNRMKNKLKTAKKTNRCLFRLDAFLHAMFDVKNAPRDFWSRDTRDSLFAYGVFVTVMSILHLILNRFHWLWLKILLVCRQNTFRLRWQKRGKGVNTGAKNWTTRSSTKNNSIEEYLEVHRN